VPRRCSVSGGDGSGVQLAKGFLSQQGVPFTVYDLNVDTAARDEFLRRGYRLPPVVVIDGIAVEGFQPDRI
jgi:hypothetical protein